MKYTKKMKLVDIDDGVTQQSIEPSYQTLPSDYNFTAPRMLSTLDNSMNEILNRRDMDDNEKWILNNQTLQKFLNYMKKSRPPMDQHTSQEQQNNSIDSFDGRISYHNITGILPFRDSLESIAHPGVRDFFKQIRENQPYGNNSLHSSPVASTSSTHSLSPNFDNMHTITPPQPQISQSVMKTPSPNNVTYRQRRGQKRTAVHDVSGVPPFKKNPTPRALFSPRNPAHHRHDFYWESTNAK